MSIEDIAKRVDALETRNRRVDSDKAWEVSWTRRVSIMLLTYFVVVLYLKFVVHIDPWINALVPIIGFLLSNLTLSFIKNEWLVRRRSSGPK